VSSSAPFLSSSAAARRLGVSTKALRLYEQRGLITPGRTAAGWRTYGPSEIARATEIVTLRALGLSLSQVARVLDDDPRALEPGWPRTRPPSKAGSDSYKARSRRSVISGPVWRRVNLQPPAN
jgi:DNA-binding transcriptional MerR regulator